MRIRNVSIGAAFVLVFVVCARSSRAGQVTVRGFLTDTLAGARGASPTNTESAKRRVASGKALYAVYDETTKRLYVLQPQQTAESWLGQRVQVTGTLSSTPLQHAGQTFDPPTGLAVSYPRSLDSTTPIDRRRPDHYVYRPAARAFFQMNARGGPNFAARVPRRCQPARCILRVSSTHVL